MAQRLAHVPLARTLDGISGGGLAYRHVASLDLESKYMSTYINPSGTVADFRIGQRVAYVEFDGKRQYGTVSSVNTKYVFVRFDVNVAKLGWDGATSQSCDPRDLVDASPTAEPAKEQPLDVIP